jgi:tetratricopeptide (TPR) repeat protein
MKDNRLMIYCIAELHNYRQLARLRADSLPKVEDALAALFAERSVEPAGRGTGGTRLAVLGPEEELDARAAGAFLLRVIRLLRSRRDDLFGFTVIAASLPPGADVEGRMRRLLGDAEEDEELWLSPECAPFFSDALELEQSGVLSLVKGARPARDGAAPLGKGQGPWIRGTLVERTLDLLTDRLNHGETRAIPLLHGPSGVGKTAILREAGERLLHGEPTVPMLRLYTIFKRRSPLHPFLNSLVPSLLRDASRHFRGPERAVWEEVGGLLAWLRGTSGEGRAAPLPDRLLEDFTIGYRLYLLAFLRMAAERLLPAIFVCEGVESYHPISRRIIARLLDDLLSSPDFLPILTTAEESMPEEFKGFDIRPLAMNPLGKREIRSLARHEFSGLEMPESLARRLRRRSGGLPASVLSLLHYLREKGAIREKGGSYEWIGREDAGAALPANPLAVSWFLIRSLPEESVLLLYLLHLAGGLVDQDELLAFLNGLGFDAAMISDALAAFAARGLISGEDAIIPRFPGLRKMLEEHLGAEGVHLKDSFVSFILAKWSAGRYRHQILLFSFLTRSGRTDLALRVLPEIIRRKLDEGDAQGALAFCDPRRLEFAAPPSEGEAAYIAAVTAVGRLRAFLLVESAARDPSGAHPDHEDALREAERDLQSAERTLSGDTAAIVRGEAGIERAKLRLSAGDSVAAMDELKRASILLQELQETRAMAERAAYGVRASALWLGAAMLSEGRFAEAIEYLGLSERLGREAGDAFSALWASAFLASSLFLDGRYTQCLAAVRQAGAEARSACRREVELFLLFLEARCLFQLGEYEECCLRLQGCLCLAALYPVAGAQTVLRSWLGRTHLYAGDMGCGFTLLQNAPQSSETLFFLAEGAFFSGALENASLYVERALAPREEGPRHPLPEGIPWRDGFFAVEGRCFRLSRGDPYLRRTLKAFRDCLLGLRGFSGEAIDSLRRLTRGELFVDLDPGAYWHNYLYSLVLPETSREEFDDKSTILGKSLKGLQEKAGRIDAPADRAAFLTRPFWNRRILEDARERNLL